MLLKQFIPRVNYVLRGIDDDAPEADTTEYNYWLDTLHLKIQEFYADATKQQTSRYTVLNLGTIAAAAAPSFTLDDTFLDAANEVYIIDVNGKRHNYTVKKPQETDDTAQEVFIAGEDPQVLYFTQEIKAGEDIIGGTLFLPCYTLPEMPTKPGSYIPLPDANWGVYAVASAVAENDITYEDKAPNLNAKANNLYQQTGRKLSRGTHGNSRKSPYKVTKIGQRHR